MSNHVSNPSGVAAADCASATSSAFGPKAFSNSLLNVAIVSECC